MFEPNVSPNNPFLKLPASRQVNNPFANASVVAGGRIFEQFQAHLERPDFVPRFQQQGLDSFSASVSSFQSPSNTMPTMTTSTTSAPPSPPSSQDPEAGNSGKNRRFLSGFLNPKQFFKPANPNQSSFDALRAMSLAKDTDETFFTQSA